MSTSFLEETKFVRALIRVGNRDKGEISQHKDRRIK